MFLQLSKIKKKMAKGNMRKLAFLCHDVTKKKTMSGYFFKHVCSCDTLYHLQQSKSKLELFYWLFTRLKHIYEQSLKLFMHVQYTRSVMGRQKGLLFMMGCENPQTRQINRQKKSNNIPRSKILTPQTFI